MVIDDQAYLEEKNRRITLRLKAKEKPWNSVLSLFIVLQVLEVCLGAQDAWETLAPTPKLSRSPGERELACWIPSSRLGYQEWSWGLTSDC